MADEPVGTFSPAPATEPAAPAGGNDNAMIQQLFQMIMSGGMGGGMGGPGIGGGGMMMPGMADALGMGMGGDALGPAGMLNPAQAAGLRLRRNNEMNALRQNMANQHRSIGAAGGRDFSRHVQNINDEILALQEQKVQNNIENAFKADQNALAWARFNQSQDEEYWKNLYETLSSMFQYGGGQQKPGTFSPPTDQQGA